MKDCLRDIFSAALAAADPYYAVSRHLRIDGNTLLADGAVFDLARFERVVVVGAGKGASLMAKAVEDVLGDRVEAGIVIVKYGHRAAVLSKIAQIEASHPLPDEAGVNGAGMITGLLGGVDEATLVICLLSGGASSLLVAPIEGISLDDKRRTTELLLKCGASIHELNAVRKHLSRIKGGRLAELASPAPVLTLLLSDVIGDRLDVIASGPTVPDSSTFAEAMEVVKKYGIASGLPASVMRTLRDGIEGRLKETPKGGEPYFKRASAIVVGSLNESLAAAKEAALKTGFDADVVTAELQGEAREVARGLAQVVLNARASLRQGQRGRCLLYGGETTVTVKGAGSGGRNQELALAFAMEIAGSKGISMLSAGTDGTDGPTDAAGAIVDGTTAPTARSLGIDPAACLEDNDSYGFFQRLDTLSASKSHLKTGPTGTNVMDIQIIGIQAQDKPIN
jgi:glycerate 2-kinase